ncbi:MAG: molybdopterin-dependent oxidoreductase [Planctomycetota bacterium]
MPARELRTTCSRDCPDACGILARVEDGRVVSLRGDPDHPVTRGFLCFRTSRYAEIARDGRRIERPMLRRGDRHVPIDWEEAFSLVAERLLAVRSESGPLAIAHYRSGGSLGILKQLADRFFDEFGPCTGKAGDICSGAGEAAQIADFGVSDSNDLFDLENSRHVVLWGKNPATSSVHLVPLLKEIRARGAGVILVDPIHHRSRSLADSFVQPSPGRDAELALGVARDLLDRDLWDPKARERCSGLEEFRSLVASRKAEAWASAAGVSLGDLRVLAEAMADGPCAILVGWGLQRRLRGSASVRVLDALSAISGNLFRPGGGSSFYFRRRGAFARIGPPDRSARRLREPLFGADLLAAQDPEVRLLWVTAGNPIAMLPDSATVARAIESREFVVVADCFWSDTARRAHLVLPVPAMLEDDDLLGAYGHHWIGESRPVVEPPEGVRHEVAIFQELARRLGLSGYPQQSIEELKRAALAPVAGRGASLEDLRRAGAVRNPLAARLVFGDGRVATEDGRVRLIDRIQDPPAIEAPPARPGASEPLWLFSNSTARSQGSVWSSEEPDRLPVTVHPDVLPCAEDGAPILVESRLGTLRGVLRRDPCQRRDAALVPKGGSFDRGTCANALVEAAATDEGLGAAYLDCLVRIRPQ